MWTAAALGCVFSALFLEAGQSRQPFASARRIAAVWIFGKVLAVLGAGFVRAAQGLETLRRNQVHACVSLMLRRVHARHIRDRLSVLAKLQFGQRSERER